MLTESEIKDMVREHGQQVNEGRTIRQIIADGDLPRLKEMPIYEGKVSDSLVGLKIWNGIPLRLMYRSNRISTHDQNRGAIPFKDQVLAQNHDHMHSLVNTVLGSAQFSVPDLKPSSTVIPAENLSLFRLENVLRMFMAESSTSTSLYQHWLQAKKKGESEIQYAGHLIDMNELAPNGRLPYLMDTPSTKGKSDKTIDPQYLFDEGICTPKEYHQIRNASMMAFGIVSEYLRDKGMVLVDTKTEHGSNMRADIVAADELYTMDSSRFWKLDDDGSIMLRDGKPVSFSKEFARGMVTQKDQQFTTQQANEIAERYIQGVQHLTGKEFEPDLRPRDERIIDSTNQILDHLL